MSQNQSETIGDLLGDDFARIAEIFRCICAERVSQLDTRDYQDHSDSAWLAILSEEVGEVAKGMLEQEEIRQGLIQTAAVAIAWIEDMDRRE